MTTLRTRLALRYSAVAVACLMLLGGLARHEFISEPHLRARRHIPEPADEWFAEFGEVFFYGMIPVILGAGWWWMRRVLNPINTLAGEMERIQLHKDRKASCRERVSSPV